MNQNISAAETLFSAAHPDIKKITNISALILSLLFVRWDCAFCFFVESGRFLFRVRSCPAGRRNRLSGGRRYSPDDKKKESDIRSDRQFGEKGSCFFDAGDLSVLGRLLEEKTFDGKAEVLPKKDGGVRMDYMVSQDGNFAAVQLLKYVPYAYEPASSVLHYTGEEASAFVNALRVGRF